MPRIKKLSQQLISKIAAGEAIEGPASIVKELIENSIDAGASGITISIVEGGIKEIVVADDGCGMDFTDLSECFKRHTTSKISCLSDLNAILSFGFRGEALASMASVSQMRIQSRSKKDIEGRFINLEEGAVTDSGTVGMPVGTIVCVKNLFYNLPARMKYLKKEGTELRYVMDVLLQICLGNPQIGFKFSHNGKELLNIPADKDLSSRARSLLTEKEFSNLLLITNNHLQIEMEGFVSKPQAARASKLKQFLYINGRFVKDGAVSKSIENVYGNLLGKNKHPIYILFLKLPPEAIDVNVHPRKEKVRFLNKEALLNFISESVNAVLEKEDLTFIKSGYKKLDEQFGNYYGTSSKMEIFKLHDFENIDSSENQILQLFNTYLITQTGNKFTIIDQHAAHEKIIFEDFLSHYENTASGKDSAHYFMPEQSLSFEFDMQDKILFDEHKAFLEKLGFAFGDSRNTRIIVKAVPSILEGRNIGEIIKEYLDTYTDNSYIGKLDTNTTEALSHLACKSAVKAGQFLNMTQRQWLVSELSNSRRMYTCPHGRPLKVEVTLEELNTWFERS